MNNCRNTHNINVSPNIHSVPAFRILNHVTAFNKNIFFLTSKNFSKDGKYDIQETPRDTLSQNVHKFHSWWRHQMETFSTLLAICAGNSPVPGEFPDKGQWRGAFMFSLIWVWINGWVNNRDLRRYRAHYDVIVMSCHIQQAWELHCHVIDRNLIVDWINQGDAMKTSGLQDKAGMINRAKTGFKWNIGQYFTIIIGNFFHSHHYR